MLYEMLKKRGFAHFPISTILLGYLCTQFFNSFKHVI